MRAPMQHHADFANLTPNPKAKHIVPLTVAHYQTFIAAYSPILISPLSQISTLFPNPSKIVLQN